MRSNKIFPEGYMIERKEGEDKGGGDWPSVIIYDNPKNLKEAEQLFDKNDKSIIRMVQESVRQAPLSLVKVLIIRDFNYTLVS